jgi:hypothetical protein
MRKQYPIDQSPLYHIVGLNQLEKCLNIKLNRLDKLLKDGSYRVWINYKGREIQHPLGWLAEVHGRIARYLSRIETPEYVFSKKGRSYVDNAHEHIGYSPLAKTDISSFYPSTNRQMIKDMFVSQFKCAKDIANILADICCYEKKHLPTGSAISGYLAFLAHKSLFDKVYALSKERGCTFTLYVDDLTISGDAATKKLINEVRIMIKRQGLTSKRSKTQTFSSHSAKTITGVIIKGNRCLLPNRRHNHIDKTRTAIQNSTDAVEKEQLKKTLKGSLLEARQINAIDEGRKDHYPKLIFS